MTTPLTLRVPQTPPRFTQKFMPNWPLALICKALKATFIAAPLILWHADGTAQSASAPAAGGHVAASLPLLGDGSDMTSNEERRIGDRIARELFRDPDYLDDAPLSDYVHGIWQALLAAARQRGDLSAELDERFAWQVMLGRDRSVNAFALPGGYLGLNLGLLAVVSSKDELASVLGHELSHVTQRHIARLMSKNAQQTPWVIGAMILGMLAASKGNGEAGNALMVGGQALSAQSQLNFSRDMEREADRIGYGVMTQAGFEPLGFVTMFDKLQQAARLNDTGAYPYLRSHPLTTERIADMQARRPLGAPQAASAPPTPLHAMMVARARVLANPGVDALRAWANQATDAALAAQPPSAQITALYGAAMAASRLREPEQARRYVSRLTQVVAKDPAALQQANWLGAETALAARDPAAAAVWLHGARSALARAPGAESSRTALFLQAEEALQSDSAAGLDEAAQALQSRVTNQPRDALAWQWLAQVYAAQRQSLRALRAQAEARVAQLDYSGAIDRLRAAQDDAASTTTPPSSARHIDASIVDTRLRQVEALLKAQLAER